jgi:hypothetical protein
MQPVTAVQRLSRTANLVIFLGLLYTILHIGGVLGLLHGYTLPGLLIAVSLLGLGYGIRYGSRACLYVATGICAGLSLYGGVLTVLTWRPYAMLRLVLSAWSCWRLAHAIPLMRALRYESVFPLPMSRYGERFLHRRRS